ncbi:MAG TPA: hypothetical protein VIP70_02330 [Nitrososphaeraceae archaeon]
MDYSGYISAAYKYDFKKVKITENDYDFFFSELLEWELKFGPFSVYKIYSQMKKQGDSIAYKNVHQKIQKIFSLGLIEEVEGKYLHGAKFYRISPKGWVNLIINGALTYSRIRRQVITKYYNTNIILKTFLYPYFEAETIHYLDDVSYLWECCEITLETMESLEPSEEDIRLGRVRVLPKSEQPKFIEKDYPDEFSKKTIATRLDFKVKSFLLEQVIANKETGMASILSRDEKFMNAIEDMEKEFHLAYNRLIELRMKQDQ